MATYYWIGGDGVWNNANTANWSNVSGGSGGFGPPLSTDTVIFDSASGTGTCTTASGSACATATLNSSTLGLTLGADHTMSGTFTFTSGTLSLSSYKLECSIFSSSNSNTRSILFGTGNITLTGNAGTVWTTSTATNFSYTGTPTVNATYSGSTGTRTFNTGNTEANAVSFNISAGADTVVIGAAAKNINFTGFAGTLGTSARTIYGNLIVSSGMTVNSSTSVTTFGATSGTQQITTNNKTLDFPITFNGAGGTFQLQDNLTVGSTRTVTLTNGTLDLTGNSGNWTLSCGLFSSTNTNTRSILFGTGNITVTGSGATVVDFSNATNFTRTGTPTINLTYAGSTGTRVVSLGSTAGGSESNTLNYNFTAGADTIGIGSGSSVGSLDFTGFGGTFNFGTSSRTFYGNIKLVSGMTVVGGTGVATFAATSGTQQITTASKTLDFPITFNGVGGTFAFQDALTQGSTRATTLTNGTLQLKAGVTSTVGSFATSGTNQKYLRSTLTGSQATLSDASGANSLSYTTIQDIFATGGATWNAYYANGNIDGGNNTNWNFGGTPSYDAEYGYKLRSFTEQGRF